MTRRSERWKFRLSKAEYELTNARARELRTLSPPASTTFRNDIRAKRGY